MDEFNKFALNYQNTHVNIEFLLKNYNNFKNEAIEWTIKNNNIDGLKIILNEPYFYDFYRDYKEAFNYAKLNNCLNSDVGKWLQEQIIILDKKYEKLYNDDYYV